MPPSATFALRHRPQSRDFELFSDVVEYRVSQAAFSLCFPVWALGVTALSVAFAWLYTHSKGSLLLTMLMHSGA
jgi:membrane protease YdiL (CAAX protease family)